jgi:hypothetical protein
MKSELAIRYSVLEKYKFEQIADDYAIDFLDWVFGQPKFKVKHNSKRELLEIFKKEKGL